MKIKSLTLLLLSVLVFACSDGIDVQPDTNIENVASMPSDDGTNTSVLFNVATNFVLAGGSNDEATMSFGVSSLQSAEMAIEVGFFIKASGQSNFVPIFSPYNHMVIPANQQLSAYASVKREDFGICESSFTLKMQVLEVRIGGVVIPASDYNVLGFNTDGSTELVMAGPGCSGGSGPGNVSGGSYLGTKPRTNVHWPVIPGGTGL